MTRITDRPSNERLQYRALAVLALGAVVATSILSLAQSTAFQPYFGHIHPLLAIALVTALGGVSLGMLQARGWCEIYTRRERWRGVVLASALATSWAWVTSLSRFMRRCNATAPGAAPWPLASAAPQNIEGGTCMVQTMSRLRFPLLALGMLALLTALIGGLARLGWALPVPAPTLLMAHGPLMVCGFLGTLISVERAVALGVRWLYLGPALTGLGGVALLLGLPAAPLMTLGSGGLLVMFGFIVQRQCTLATVIMSSGAALWLLGNGLWLWGWPVYQAVPWWMGFLVVTIAGERLELSHILRLSRRRQGGFVAAVGLYTLGIVVTAGSLDAGTRLAGAGMLALAVWLLCYDIARRTVRQQALTRFIAVCLLSGYVWLGIAGALSLWHGGMVAGPYYDATLHALFLGFVFAMIFGHAPVIFPAVFGAAVPYHPAFYTPLLLLHASLLLRLLGDLSGWPAGRQWGGLGNAIAIGLFFALVGHGLWRGRQTGAAGRLAGRTLHLP